MAALTMTTVSLFVMATLTKGEVAVTDVPSLEDFYDLELRGRAVVLKGERIWTDDDLESNLRSCPATPTRLKAGLLDRLVVPRYVASDYLMRLMRVAKKDHEPVLFGPTDEKTTCPAPTHAYYALVVGDQAEVDVDGESAMIEKGDALFVPFPLEKTTWSSNAKQRVLRFCFVDASNYGALRHQLLLKEEVLEGVNSTLLLEAMDSLDTAIDRDAVGVEWDTFRSGEAPMKNKTNTTHRPLQRREKKKSFAEWQQEKRWRWRVTAATIPELSPPVIGAGDHASLTVSLETTYDKEHGDDAVRFGADLEWRSIGVLQRNDTIPAAVAPLEAPLDGMRFVDEAEFRSDRKTKDVLLDGLAPGRIYEVRTRLVYGDSSGPWSQWSAQAETRPRGPPRGVGPPVPGTLTSAAHLEVLAAAPRSDGGDPVVGFVLRYKKVPSWDPKTMTPQPKDGDWISAGSVRAARESTTSFHVPGLLPPTCGDDPRHQHEYVFQVAAYNRLGLSSWSPPSKPTAPACLDVDGHILNGHGVRPRATVHHLDNDEDSDLHWSEARDAVKSELTALFNAHAHESHGPIVKVRSGNLLEVWTDHYGQPLRQPQFTCDYWNAHWSPPHFGVAAELILADPVFADTPLRNPGPLFHRVAFVERGRVPLATKALHAQQAGALAVVIADDGRCDNLDQYCVPGSDKKDGDGFAKLDNPRPWAPIHIPVVLILAPDAAIILQQFNLSNGGGDSSLVDSSLHDEL